MFNGLIREIAEVVSFENFILKVKSDLKPKMGESIAINGACLSVVEVFEGGFGVEMSKETRTHIAIENYKSKVHIEPAMKLGERIDGHLVQGHIDFIGKIVAIKQSQNATDFFIKLPKEAMSLMSTKGSVAIEGVSLTINDINDAKDEIRLTIIPITLRDTLFGGFAPGRRVNIESDCLARYTQRILNYKKSYSWDDIERIQSLY